RAIQKLPLLAKPLRKMRKGNLWGLDFWMPFLLPLERQKASIVNRLHGDAYLRQGKLTPSCQDGDAFGCVSSQVLNVNMPDQCCELLAILQRVLAALDERRCGVPYHSHSIPLRYGREHFFRA